MKPVMPIVFLPGDTITCIMAGTGGIVGFTKSIVVWRFGFLKGSLLAKACDCFSPFFLFVLADIGGKILDKYEGVNEVWLLPERFQKILEGSL